MSNYFNKNLHSIELQAYDVLAILNVVKDSCALNDYHVQASVLESAIKIQQKIMDKIYLLNSEKANI